jgi:coniferyl-aldehyde dehydrogenase
MSDPLHHNIQTADLVRDELASTLQLQRSAYFAHPVPTFDERRTDLLKVQAFIRDNREALVQAVNADYGNRSRHETLFTEIFTVIDGIDHVLKHLKSWMKPQRRAVDLRNFLGASNRVLPQPLGVVGAIVPWNFPINLSFTGLIYTFAAGNRAMVKMSKNSRHLAQLLIEKSRPTFLARSWLFSMRLALLASNFPNLNLTICSSPAPARPDAR